MDINNVVLSASYDRTATPGTALNIRHTGTERSVLDNSTLRISYSATDKAVLILNTEMYRSNFLGELAAGLTHTLFGIFRDVKSIKMGSDWVGSRDNDKFKGILDVSDCEVFTIAPSVIPDIMEFYNNNGKLVFKGCNVPGGIFYYDHNPGGNVYTDIDFTKAMADLGKSPSKNSTISLVSSNVQGMYRLYRSSGKTFLALVEAHASVVNWNIGSLSGYESVIYKDCTITGLFTIRGCNVFGGTLGGASKITNTTATTIVIDGSFRIEGNAQVTDTPLKGTGYIGDNAELKNGNVEGYVYMADNAKYIPAAVTNAAIIKHLIMTGNSKVLKQRDVTNNHVKMELSDNAVVDSVTSIDRGFLKMSGNAYLYSAGAAITPVVYGTLEMKDNAKQVGGTLATEGDITLCGGYNQTSGSPTIRGKRTIADVSEITAVELPPTKITW